MSLASTNHACFRFPLFRCPLLHRWNEIKEITRLIRERNIEGEMVRLFVLGTILTFHSDISKDDTPELFVEIASYEFENPSFLHGISRK